MDEKRVRICDIADELGLSTATVSNVIHGKTKKISDRTVQKVEALLEERQYIPSMAGILLARNSSRIIGIVINDHEKYEGHTLEDAFISSSLNYLSIEIEKNNQFMMVKKTDSPEEIIKFASMWNMEGLVLIGFCDHDYMYLRNHMRIPFVVYDGYCDCAERIYNITIDNYSGGFQVGKYFRESGHRHVLCISDNHICVDKERFDGFCEGMEEYGADFMEVPMKKSERIKFYEDNLEKIRSYTAIFAVSDYYAVEIMVFLQEHGVAVPEEISIAGFDDTPMCSHVKPTLTSVRQDGGQRAKLAMEKLCELHNKSETESTTKLDVKLIVRERTGVSRS